LLSALGVYTWRHRGAPASGPILALLLLRGFWVVFRLLELASPDLETKLLWFRLSQVTLPLLFATGISVLAEFTRPGNWLGRRHIALAYAPAVMIGILILTNPAHGLLRNRHWLDEFVHVERGPLGWAFFFYFACLILVEAVRLVRFAVRWPLFRWPAVVILAGTATSITVNLVTTAGLISRTPLDPEILVFNFNLTLYVLVAIVLGRVLDFLPMAREMAIEHMQDGIAVLNAQGRLVFQNPVAQAVLSSSWLIVGGGEAADAARLEELIERVADRPTEILVEYGAEQRQYTVLATPLEDPRGWQLGDLLLFQDITDRILARRLRVQQQRALAVLEERERIAGELHDDLGQVLGYVKLQTQAVRDLLSGKDYAGADRALAQMVSVAQNAHTDVREFILGSEAAPILERGFAPALGQYLEQLNNNFDLRTRLYLSPDWDETSWEPRVAVQLLRIVQEALTNARKHAQAKTILVKLASQDGHVQVTIQDDGQGFDPQRQVEGQRLSFGLGFMRQRAESIGAVLEVQSAPGQGTRVIISVPPGRSQA
jgi:signal transduction histidine kinase